MAASKTDNLTAQAYKHLRAEILSCRFAPGRKLVISELVAQSHFSLGAVREALSRLTSEGLVVAEPNKGYQVAPITQADLEDLTRTRIFIELECLADAIAHGDLKWESGIVATLFELSRTDLADPDDPAKVSEAWATRHARFHEALVAGCRSAWLLRIREMLYAQSERYRRFSLPLDRHRRDVNAEHQAIADAALARDGAAAAAALRKHLELTTRILMAAETSGGSAERSGKRPPR